jgi:hypothetical protein
LSRLEVGGFKFFDLSGEKVWRLKAAVGARWSSVFHLLGQARNSRVFNSFHFRGKDSPRYLEREKTYSFVSVGLGADKTTSHVHDVLQFDVFNGRNPIRASSSAASLTATHIPLPVIPGSFASAEIMRLDTDR